MEQASNPANPATKFFPAPGPGRRWDSMAAVRVDARALLHRLNVLFLAAALFPSVLPTAAAATTAGGTTALVNAGEVTRESTNFLFLLFVVLAFLALLMWARSGTLHRWMQGEGAAAPPAKDEKKEPPKSP